MSGARWLGAALQLGRLLRSQWHAPERLRAEQRRLLELQLRHAYESVPHYRQSWGPEGAPRAERLSTLPLLRREEIQADPKAFLSERGDPERWQRSRTSGSTARPLESRFDRDTWQLCKHALKLRRLLAGGWRPGERVAVIEAVPRAELETHRRTYSVPGEGWLGGRRFFSLYDVPELQLAEYERYRPHHLYAPPSYLEDLARVWSPRQRQAVPLRSLMTSSEWMHPRARARLVAAFGVPLLDVYGSTEFKEVAWQCGEGSGYHVNAESVWVELLDEAGLPVAPGESGELVITSLTNRAMPLVRYATGDRARALEEACPCGRGLPLLGDFEGRTVDAPVLPDGRRISPYALTMAVEECPGVVQYRIVQSAPDCLEVPLVVRGSADAAASAARARLAEVVGTAMRIAVSVVPELPREPSGKRRPVSVARELLEARGRRP